VITLFPTHDIATIGQVFEGGLLIVISPYPVPSRHWLPSAPPTRSRLLPDLEPLPVPKAVGDEMFAGTPNSAETLWVRVDRTASETVVIRIVAMVQASATRWSPLEIHRGWHEVSSCARCLRHPLAITNPPVLSA
ncbi:MAG: hypothetical protein ACRDS1_13415, partial [Pseudonocardiaceae bacterium]